jgi:hypothetical protein
VRTVDDVSVPIKNRMPDNLIAIRVLKDLLDTCSSPRSSVGCGLREGSDPLEVGRIIQEAPNQSSSALAGGTLAQPPYNRPYDQFVRARGEEAGDSGENPCSTFNETPSRVIHNICHRLEARHPILTEWVQPERIAKIDRVPIRIPVGIEPSRDADGVRLRGIAL